MSSIRMPALFLGHGSPMNVLEDNLYTRSWQTLGMTLPRRESDCRGFRALVYPRYGGYCDGSTAYYS